MKKFLSVVCIASLIVLWGCTKNVSVDMDTQILTEWQTYENKADNFSIQFPGSRTFEENVYGSSVMFFTPLSEGDQLRENIGIIKKILDKEYTLDEYYAITKPELENMIPDFTEISKEDISINGIDIQKLIYQGTQSNMRLQWMQSYLIKNKDVYIITYTATKDTFVEFADKVDEMIMTLNIK